MARLEEGRHLKPGGPLSVATGFCVFFLCTREHYIAAPDGWLLERTPHSPTPSYLLTGGPYRHSCNPMNLAELVNWLGWILFYGSFALASFFAAIAVVIGPVVVPREERGLEIRFGDAYRRVPPHHTAMVGENHTLESKRRLSWVITSINQRKL
jgi:protein-S-isoprenylcysteine O-methyltransferase Ste14